VAGPILEERLGDLLTLTQLGRFRRRLTDALSGGMKQKLALAAALLHAPRLLLLDEPTTGVDPASRGDFWEMLLGLAEKGTTVMAATACMDEAERCRRVGLLYRGRLLECGSPDEIRREAGLSLLQVSCRPLHQGRRAAQEMAGVQWVEVFGDRLHVALGSEGTAEAVRESLERAGAQVRSIDPIAPGLEDAFFELVRRGRKAAA
jgi:ABC-2 type transport system ATP-binding protein